jgi:hypothetical protein
MHLFCSDDAVHYILLTRMLYLITCVIFSCLRCYSCRLLNNSISGVGDCFFYSVAQGMNELCIPGGPFNVKTLRRVLYDYAEDKQNSVYVWSPNWYNFALSNCRCCCCRNLFIRWQELVHWICKLSDMYYRIFRTITRALSIQKRSKNRKKWTCTVYVRKFSDR